MRSIKNLPLLESGRDDFHGASTERKVQTVADLRRFSISAYNKIRSSFGQVGSIFFTISRSLVIVGCLFLPLVTTLSPTCHLRVTCLSPPRHLGVTDSSPVWHPLAVGSSPVFRQRPFQPPALPSFTALVRYRRRVLFVVVYSSPCQPARAHWA